MDEDLQLLLAALAGVLATLLAVGLVWYIVKRQRWPHVLARHAKREARREVKRREHGGT